MDRKPFFQGGDSVSFPADPTEPQKFGMFVAYSGAETAIVLLDPEFRTEEYPDGVIEVFVDDLKAVSIH